MHHIGNKGNLFAKLCQVHVSLLALFLYRRFFSHPGYNRQKHYMGRQNFAIAEQADLFHDEMKAG
jgi:hypothetical protein